MQMLMHMQRRMHARSTKHVHTRLHMHMHECPLLPSVAPCPLCNACMQHVHMHTRSSMMGKGKGEEGMKRPSMTFVDAYPAGAVHEGLHCA
jgi:hypothetical protein